MELVYILVFGYLLMVPVAAVVAFRNRSRLQRQDMEIRHLNRMVDHLERQLRRLADALRPEPEAETPAAVLGVQPQPVATAEAAAPADTRTEEVPAPEVELVAEAVAPEPEPEPEPAAARTAEEPAGQAATKPQPAGFAKMERDVSSRWMMWVGGLALALGGAFLVKYSIDAGILGPSVRVALGTLLGVALGVGGELVRRRRHGITWLDGAPDYLPGALSAAGLFTLFASIYSAYALYDLLPAMAAFIALAGISVAASALAYLQGRFFAYLGLIGGMVVPMLVSTGSPSAYGLFPYLLFILAASLWVARLQAWVDVAGSALVLALLWVPVWIAGQWHTGDILPVGLYLLAVGALNTTLLSGASPERSTEPAGMGLIPRHPVSVVTDLVALGAVLLLVSVIRLEHYSAFGLGLFFVALLAQAYAVVRDAEHDAGGLMVLLGALFLLATWHVPSLLDLDAMMGVAEAHQLALAPIAPPGFATFVSVSALLAGGVGFALFFGLSGLLRKGMWASVGVAFPLVVLILVYARIRHFDPSYPFAAIAVAMAALFAAAVTSLNRKSGFLGEGAIAAYAAGATGALALGLAMVLRDAWLSFALALELVALGQLWRRFSLPALRVLALWLGVIVLVRLLFNPAVASYGGLGALPPVNWLFYGYGLTAGLFAYANRLFGMDREGDRLHGLLQAGAVLLLVAFTTFEIRVLFGEGGRLVGDMTALEAALQSINWTAASTVLYWRELKHGDAMVRVLRRLMTFLSVGGLLFGGGYYNAFTHGAKVGPWIVLNLQLLQFFVPACLYGFKAWLAYRAGQATAITRYGTVALALAWFWLTAEVRHAFRPHGGHGSMSDWEVYSYSAVWLGYAVALLLAGLRFGQGAIRMAGLGMLAFVVVKVFVFDMSSLEGIARALSFMGLGAALIGMGYLYQRFRQAD